MPKYECRAKINFVLSIRISIALLNLAFFETENFNENLGEQTVALCFRCTYMYEY